MELPSEASPLTLAGMAPQPVEWQGETRIAHDRFVVVLQPRPAELADVRVRFNPALGFDFTAEGRWLYTTTREHKGAGDEKPRWARVAGKSQATSRWARGGVGLHSTCSDTSDEGLAWCSALLRLVAVHTP